MWAILTFTFNVGAVELTLVPLGQFGSPLQNCEVQRFAPLNVGKMLDVKDQFHGLVAEGIKPGIYDVRLECHEGEVSKLVEVSGEENAVYMVASTVDPYISDHRKGIIKIQLKAPVTTTDHVYLRLTGILNDESQTGLFKQGDAVEIVRPSTGIYSFVAGTLEGNKSCLFVVNLSAFTRVWQMNLTSCDLQTDKESLVLFGQSRPSQAEKQWDNNLNKKQEEFIEMLKNAPVLK